MRDKQRKHERTKTKIICTIGPACNNPHTIAQMIDNGMTVARLNFSHGDLVSHAKTYENVQTGIQLSQSKCCAILLDTKGPEIRTGMLINGEPIKLVKDQLLDITTDYDHIGDSSKISCSYQSLCKTVQRGSTILCADGSIEFKVEEVGQNEIKVRVMNDQVLGQRKNMNIPGKDIDLPTLIDKDISDI